MTATVGEPSSMYELVDGPRASALLRRQWSTPRSYDRCRAGRAPPADAAARHRPAGRWRQRRHWRTAPPTTSRRCAASTITTALDTLERDRRRELRRGPRSADATGASRRSIAHCELQPTASRCSTPPRPLRAVRRRQLEAQRAGSTRRAATPRSTTRGCVVRQPLADRRSCCPPSGHVCGIFARSDKTAACTRRPPTRSSTARSASSERLSHIEQGQLNLLGHQRRCRVFQDGGRRCCGARARPPTDTQLAVRQHPPAVPVPRGVDPGGHPLGRVRAEQPRAVAEAQAHAHRLPHARVARRRAVRRQAPRRRSTCASTRSLNPFSEQRSAA